MAICAVFVRGEAWHEKESVAHFGRNVFARSGEWNGQRIVGTHGAARGGGGVCFDGGGVDGSSRVHVGENAVEFTDEQGDTVGFEAEAGKRGDVPHVFMRDRH